MQSETRERLRMVKVLPERIETLLRRLADEILIIEHGVARADVVALTRARRLGGLLKKMAKRLNET